MDKKDALTANDTKQNLNIVKRIKLKRLTKLICTLDEKWDNADKLFELLSLGVDGIEIYSEINKKTQEELISKIRNFAKENTQFITILYNISYFHVYVSRINNSDQELSINKNDIIYIKNNHENEKLSEDTEKSSLSPYIYTEPNLVFQNFSQDIIHINYGEISFKVEVVNANYLKCIALNSGIIHKQSLISV